MTWLDVSLTSNQRISLGTGGQRAFLTRTFPLIPGSVLRGALAAAWLREHGNAQPFSAVMENSRFGPLLPEGVDIAPQSVWSCKYHGSQSDCEHFQDRAFGENETTCGTAEPLKGGYRSNLIPRAVTATALEPGRHVAKKQHLFSRETLPATTTFQGHIYVPDSLETDTLCSLTRVFVGGRTSIMGRSAITIRKRDDSPYELTLNPDVDEVVLRTLSPTILVDDAGLPSTNLRGALEAVGLTVKESWPVRVEPDSCGGWHAASGLPKPSEIAVAAGATVKVEMTGSVSKVLAHGIGLRRAEGYGWLIPAGKPWRPPAPPHLSDLASQGNHLSNKWAEEVAALQLTPGQEAWLARQLRYFEPDDAAEDSEFQDRMEKVLAEPAAKALTKIQKSGGTMNDCTYTGVISIVRQVPRSQRRSLAHYLTKGAR